jgi:hypothetical protein
MAQTEDTLSLHIARRLDRARNLRRGREFAAMPFFHPFRFCLVLALASSASALRPPRSAVTGVSLPNLRATRDGESIPASTLATRSTQLQASSSDSALSQWWSENKSIITALAGALAVLSPVLLKLPRPAGICASILVIALVQMAFDLPPDLVLLEAVVGLIAFKVISVKDALDGFRSEGVVAVGVMCAVAKAVQTTGGIQLISRYLLGSPKGYEMALLRMTLAVMAISAFMNNTPVCAMMMPILASWAGTVGVSPASLLMPLSFATMLGGTLTMIGSSTNLVAANAAHLHDPSFSMKVFDISKIGLVNALAGTAYMVLFGRKLLPQGGAVAPKPASADVASAPPRGSVRLWLTLGLITVTMTVAAKSPKALLPMALGCLCILVRCGCLTLKEAWSAVNGPVLLSIALSCVEPSGLNTPRMPPHPALPPAPHLAPSLQPEPSMRTNAPASL